jgi:hypothetical protein
VSSLFFRKIITYVIRAYGSQNICFLKLIFNDVWGFAPVLAYNGFQYFVIFMDVHTKFIWFYLIVVKSNVFNVLNDNFLVKLNMFKLIGVVDIVNSIPFLKQLIFIIV